LERIVAIPALVAPKKVRGALSMSACNPFLRASTKLGRAMRHHWHVENRLQWVLDVSFREDDSRVRVGDGAQNFAGLRHLALNLLCHEPAGRGSVATKRFRAALDETYLRTLLGGLAATN
jgi:predicted transposase YbfD/YdcC